MGIVGRSNRYVYLTAQDARAYTVGRRGQSIKEIVLHHWGAKAQTFEQVMGWFCDNPRCETSAHYVVEAGRVACIVSPHDTAYHAGVWQRNLQSIGIECRPEATSEDYNTVAMLVADIWREWGILPIVPHNAIVPTACPGDWNVGRVERMAKAYYDEFTAPHHPTAPDKWAEQAWAKATQKGLLDGTNPKSPLTRQELAIVLERLGAV